MKTGKIYLQKALLFSQSVSSNSMQPHGLQHTRFPHPSLSSGVCSKSMSIELMMPEGLILKLKLQYFSHLMRRTDSLEKTMNWERVKAGGEGDDRR